MAARLSALVVLLSFLAGATGSARGITWWVAADGSDADPGSEDLPFGTIQHAIGRTAAGDTVKIMPGTYSGDGNRDLDFGGKGIVLRSSADDPETVVIDCQGSAEEPHRGFWFHSGEDSTAVLRGLTITGGGGVEWGGGILVGDPNLLPADGLATSPRITRCIIRQNGAGQGAGVAVVNEQSFPLIVACEIRENLGDGLLFARDVMRCRVDGCEILLNSGAGFRSLGIWTFTGNDHVVRDTVIRANSGDGLRHGHGETYGSIDIVRCEISGNGGWGVYSNAFEAGDLDIAGGSVSENGLGGVRSHDYSTTIENCTVSDNLGTGIAGFPEDDGRILACTISGNTGDGIGVASGARFSAVMDAETKGTNYTISGCEITANGGRGIHVYLMFSSILSGNLVSGNGSTGLELEAYQAFEPQQLTLTGNTVCDNGGAGLIHRGDMAWSVDANVIAFNQGEAVVIDTGVPPHVACTNIFGNTGGDWVAVPDQLGVEGNFSRDPRFCDRENGDYTLLDISPCADGNHPDGAACGPIGALEVGCTAAPAIIAITDVASDQGRQVRIRWRASHLDGPQHADPVIGYGIYRAENGEATEIPVAESRVGGTSVTLAGWDYLGEAPARGDSEYQLVVPTLCDSTVHATCWTRFFVSAVTGQPFVFYDSAVDSGYSVDNLAPATPQDLRFRAPDVLAWDGVDVPDLGYYAVYASADEQLTPDERIGATTADSLDVTGFDQRYFGVSAVDLAGNESPPALIARVTHAPSSVPGAFALHQNAPNPFNPRTEITYDLPRATPVWLDVYDLSGRRVRTLRSGDVEGPGRHTATWDGCDDRRRAAAAGVYLYRLQAGGFVEIRRMALLR
ncbi:MAG: right-handed parallel beta-helix repeat-containing protein [Candidatus Krumholzibacteriia bacterium]